MITVLREIKGEHKACLKAEADLVRLRSTILSLGLQDGWWEVRKSEVRRVRKGNSICKGT